MMHGLNPGSNRADGSEVKRLFERDAALREDARFFVEMAEVRAAHDRSLFEEVERERNRRSRPW